MIRENPTAGNRLRLILSILAGLVAFLGVTAVNADADVSARLDIKPAAWGYFGEVESKVSSRCSAGRRVEVFVRRSGAKRFVSLGRTKARRITSRIDPDRGGYRWRLTTRAEGRFYAKALAKRGCKAARSPVIQGIARGPGGKVIGDRIPRCPARDHSVCRLDELHLDASLCPGFTKYAGTCSGSISGPSPWWANGGDFHWSDRVGNYRTVEMSAYTPQDMHVDKWRIEGAMSGPEVAEWGIEDAWNKGDGEPVLHWNAPHAGKAGELGGPLHVDFQNGILGADIYVYGYLYRKP